MHKARLPLAIVVAIWAQFFAAYAYAQVCNINPYSCIVERWDSSTGGGSCVFDRYASSSRICRPSTDSCDTAENCTGTSATCPKDLKAPLGAICRAATNSCDIAEVCNGISATCPATDTYQPNGTPCDDSDACTTGETCNASGTCAGGTALNCNDGLACTTDTCDPVIGCRNSVISDTCLIGGACYTDGDTNPVAPCQVCNSAASQKAWSPKPAGTVCRGTAGTCDIAEVCNDKGACPADTLKTVGTECRASAGICDTAEICNGISAVCPADVFEPATTNCRASTGICDIAENCAGSGAKCPTDAKRAAGAECRASVGECDIAETCDGTNTTCPADAKQIAGAACNSDATYCTDDICNGTDAACTHPSRAGCECEPGETRACYTGPAGTQGVGICRGGTQTCSATGTWGICENEVIPTTETCNNIDDNCDGKADENIIEDCTVQGAVGICAPGRRQCTAGRFSACESIDQVTPCGSDECFTDKTCRPSGQCAGGTAVPDPAPNSAPDCFRRECEPSQGWISTPDEEQNNQTCNDGDACTSADTCADLLAPVALAETQLNNAISAEGQETVTLDALQVQANAEIAACIGGVEESAASAARLARDEADAQARSEGRTLTDAELQAIYDARYSEVYDAQIVTCNQQRTDFDQRIAEQQQILANATAAKVSAQAVYDTALTEYNEAVANQNLCRGTMDPEVGGACAEGIGACSRNGTIGCDSATGATSCSATPAAPGVEVCNNVDDDCDGAIDNLAPEIEPCGLGICSGGARQRECSTGLWSEWSTCSTAGWAVPEVCNGLDDDCDGEVDDGLMGDTTCPDDGNPCTVDEIVGTGCAARCEHNPGNAGVECRASQGACDLAESCDGKLAACPADTFKAAKTSCRRSAGECDLAEECTGSSAACPADVFKSATTECRASAGACDIVENCTGATAVCPADARRTAGTECRTSAGDCDIAEACDGANVACPADVKKTASSSCTADATFCTDDICDGTDVTCTHPKKSGCECEPGATQACYAGPAGTQGVGICRGGTQTCGEGGTWGACTGEVIPTTEACNNTDDDCDGTVDNGLTRQCGTTDVGECAFGTETCGAGTWSVCNAINPVTETCNGLDDDCDGTVDNGNPGAGGACGDCGTLQCQGGSLQCVGDTTLTGSQACGAGTCTGTQTHICQANGTWGAWSDCNTSGNTCDDGSACTEGTTCSAEGSCQGGTTRTEETQNCGTGDCTGTQRRACSDGQWSAWSICNSSARTCDDHDMCTGAGACTDAGTCASGTAITCDDGNACTSNTCESASGCRYPPIAGSSGTANACGGCAILTGNIDDHCGSCGTLACSPDKESLVCSGDHPLNACGGCETLANAPGTTCGDCGTWQCDGTNAVKCQGSESECRPSAGECDIAEICSASGTCPADTFKAAKASCRRSAGECDLAEECTGSSAACPADVFKSATTECRASAGACDIVENCTGATAVCPADARRTAGTECRASAGDCDIGETCDGANVACPADVKKTASSSCTADATFCTDDICNGTDVTCTHPKKSGCECEPDTTQACYTGPAGTQGVGICRGGTQTCGEGGTWGACTGEVIPTTEACNNTDDDCDGTVDNGLTRQCGTTDVGECAFGTETCGAGTWSVCNAINPVTETCNGLDDDCDGTVDNGLTGDTTCPDEGNPCTVDEIVGTGCAARCEHRPGNAGVECRASAGACDLPESCDGRLAACPADAFKAAKASCRASEGECDLAEECTGSSAACPADVFKPATTECRAADSTNACDTAEFCSGRDAACPTADAKQRDGTACSDNDACTQTDTCQDGVCTGANPIVCTASDQCHNAGICDRTTGRCSNPTKADDTTCDDGNACTENDICSAGTCQAGVQKNCDDSDACTVDTCSAGACSHANNPACVCAVGETRSCTKDRCTGTQVCLENRTGFAECATTTCTCDTAARPDCGTGACAGTTTCDTAAGNWSACDYSATVGVECRASAGECDATEVCDGRSSTCPADTFAPITTECRARNASDACDLGAKCDGTKAECPVNARITACISGDGCCADECSASEDHDCAGCGNGRLDEGEQCDTAIAAGENGACPTTCTDDGNVCTEDIIEGSACTARCSHPPKTDAVVCDDGNACTETDGCKAGACDGTPKACDSGDACKINGLCGADGVCAYNDITACENNDNCCPAGCNSGNDNDCAPGCGNGFVDAGELCDTTIPEGSAGACPKTCDAGSAGICKTVTLDKAGTCFATCETIDKTDNTPCDDTTVCNGHETCNAGVCTNGPAPACDDYNPCTDNACDPAAGCKYENNTASCDNGDACTENDTCSSGTCQAGTPKDCGDGDSCTTDACTNGSCTHTNDPSCVCAIGETRNCDKGRCAGTQTCMANRAGWEECVTTTCTCDTAARPDCGTGACAGTATCDTATGNWGACVYPAGEICDDGNACTEDDRCSAVGACQSGAPKDCGDGDPCTIDGCLAGTCTHEPDPACVCTIGATRPCGDVAACPGVETCIASGGARAWSPCDFSAVANTHSECDSDLCTTGDTCTPNGTCLAGQSKTCGDADACTTDSCEPSIGACVFAPQAGLQCNDGNACTIGDTCNASGVCAESASQITECKGADGCCPAGCNTTALNMDTDCPAGCGNGIVETGELCDTGITDENITGACPTACPDSDSNACTREAPVGELCQRRCAVTTTTDGCSIAGSCRLAGEHNPADACQVCRSESPDVWTPITECANGDGCCDQTRCNAANDGDCRAVCGNSVLETGEACDTAIEPGRVGSCPRACMDDGDGNACTSLRLVPNGCLTECLPEVNDGCSIEETCVGVEVRNAADACLICRPGRNQTAWTAIGERVNGDGCCAEGSVASNDTDCPGCGNGRIEAGEACDASACELGENCNDCQCVQGPAEEPHRPPTQGELPAGAPVQPEPLNIPASCLSYCDGASDQVKKYNESATEITGWTGNLFCNQESARLIIVCTVPLQGAAQTTGGTPDVNALSWMFVQDAGRGVVPADPVWRERTPGSIEKPVLLLSSVPIETARSVVLPLLSKSAPISELLPLTNATITETNGQMELNGGIITHSATFAPRMGEPFSMKLGNESEIQFAAPAEVAPELAFQMPVEHHVFTVVLAAGATWTGVEGGPSEDGVGPRNPADVLSKLADIRDKADAAGVPVTADMFTDLPWNSGDNFRFSIIQTNNPAPTGLKRANIQALGASDEEGGGSGGCSITREKNMNIIAPIVLLLVLILPALLLRPRNRRRPRGHAQENGRMQKLSAGAAPWPVLRRGGRGLL